MTNGENYRAKQQELENTEQQLKNAKAQLTDKENALESAKLKNEDEKTELIKKLLDEIDALNQNVQNYELQIASINEELNTLRENFDAVNTRGTQNNGVENSYEVNQGQLNIPQASTNIQQTSADIQQTSADISQASSNISQASIDISQTSTNADSTIDSYKGYKEALSQLIFEIDGCTATTKHKSGLNQSGKQTLKTAREKLKQYKSTIKNKKNALEREFNAKNKLNSKNSDRAPLEVNISKAEIDELKNRRFARKQQIEYDIKQGQMGKSSNTAPRPNQSVEQVQTGNNVDRKHIKYDIKLNEALQDAAFLRTIDSNQDAAREFLQAIANNSLSDQQIVFCQMNMNQLSPYFDKYGMRDLVYENIQNRGGRYNTSYQNYGNIDGKTAYKVGGVTGWLNSTLIKAFPNAKPEQVSSFTNIAVAAGGIYAIYRVGKRFFGKNKEGKRNLLGKTALLAGGYFVPQLLLGQDGYSLLGDILTGKADFSELKYRASNCLRFLNNNDPEVYKQMAPGLLGMTIFPQDYTVDKVRTLQQTFSDQNARKQRYSSTYNRLNEDNSALANEFKNTFNENQYNENEWNAFLAKLGITDTTKGDTLVFNEASKTADKKTSFELWMKSQGKERKSEFKQEIDNYLKQKGEFNPNDLNSNWFKDKTDAKYTMREEDIQNKENLNDKVENLPLNSNGKSELKSALEKFYDERTIESKPNPNDFNLRFENGLLILTSHTGQEAKIDMSKKELVGFGNGITFTDLSELLNVADLANKILEGQKGKSPKGTPVFEYKAGRGGRGIYFNDADTLSLNFDTRVLSGGWGGTIGKINNLDNHPNEYADYLSKRRIESNKINIDGTQYPIVKGLSDSGIIFTNEQEVKDLEIWLSEIKEGKKFSVAIPNGTPFKVSRQFKSLNNKLVFTAVDGSNEVFQENISEKFPTILREKDKFEKFMNNPNNGMRGSAI